jgi:hypothetical protein
LRTELAEVGAVGSSSGSHAATNTAMEIPAVIESRGASHRRDDAGCLTSPRTEAAILRLIFDILLFPRRRA